MKYLVLEIDFIWAISAQVFRYTSILSYVSEINSTSCQVTNYSIEVFREDDLNSKTVGVHNHTIDENKDDTLVTISWIDKSIGWWALTLKIHTG